MVVFYLSLTCSLSNICGLYFCLTVILFLRQDTAYHLYHTNEMRYQINDHITGYSKSRKMMRQGKVNSVLREWHTYLTSKFLFSRSFPKMTIIFTLCTHLNERQVWFNHYWGNSSCFTRPPMTKRPPTLFSSTEAMRTQISTVNHLRITAAGCLCNGRMRRRAFIGNLHPLHSSQSGTSVTQTYSHHCMATTELEHTCHFKHMTTAGPEDICNHSSLEAESGKLQVLGQLRLYSEKIIKKRIVKRCLILF